MMPQRIQRKRVKGWRMPENTVYVGRPGPYGNPFRIGHHYKQHPGGIPRMGIGFIYLEAYEGHQDETYTTIKDNAEATEWFRWYTTVCGRFKREEYMALRGKNLACWCPPHMPCHADVLLEMANAEAL